MPLSIVTLAWLCTKTPSPAPFPESVWPFRCKATLLARTVIAVWPGQFRSCVTWYVPGAVIVYGQLLIWVAACAGATASRMSGSASDKTSRFIAFSLAAAARPHGSRDTPVRGLSGLTVGARVYSDCPLWTRKSVLRGRMLSRTLVGRAIERPPCEQIMCLACRPALVPVE